jgi:hypothetical protein
VVTGRAAGTVVVRPDSCGDDNSSFTLFSSSSFALFFLFYFVDFWLWVYLLKVVVVNFDD